MAGGRSTVRLRRKTLSGGRQSLYLDIYSGGRRSYEFLSLYLAPERTREDRERNRLTLALAEGARSRRAESLREPRPYDGTELLPFLDSLAAESPGRAGRWANCRRHLARYCGGRPVRLADIGRAWVEGFRTYLDNARVLSHPGCASVPRTPLSRGTKSVYLGVLKTCLRAAASRGLIPRDPSAGVRGFGTGEPRRVYLTLDEARSLAATPCRYPVLRRAFLFSCLTGLRKSDTLALTWGEVERNGDFTRLVYRQRKTGGQEYLDISPQAVEYMGERGRDTDRVFPLFLNDRMGDELRRWARDAGIRKHVTFHSARHTFAVLMLDLGADIYTLQKLLGHRELRTTQIYAELLDKRKQDAVMLIPGL